MKKTHSVFFGICLILLTNIVNEGVFRSSENKEFQKITLTGSTPGDHQIKSQLHINEGLTLDFIRWELDLFQNSTFYLKIGYGENQPNTLGFKNGGESKEFKGKYSISKIGNTDQLIFKTEDLNFSLLKLNDNLYHLLTDDKKLMVGNGGWSYTLNNKFPDKTKPSFPLRIFPTNIEHEKKVQVIFDGRTPCREFAREHNFNVSDACFKLKWKLTLNRDSVSLLPSTYSFRIVIDNAPKEITGKWTIVKKSISESDVLIIQLNSEKSDQTISLFVGDDNVLYFLDKSQHLFSGNENFSFTLNRRL